MAQPVGGVVHADGVAAHDADGVAAGFAWNAEAEEVGDNDEDAEAGFV